MNRFVLKVTSDSGTLSPLISIYWRWNKRKKEITLFTNQQTNLNCFTYSRCFHCPGNRCRYSIYSITLLHVSWLIFWRRILSVFGLLRFCFWRHSKLSTTQFNFFYYLSLRLLNRFRTSIPASRACATQSYLFLDGRDHVLLTKHVHIIFLKCHIRSKRS